MKITKKDKIGDVMKRYPEAVHVFMKYGLGCMGCHAAGSETIEEASEAHEIDMDSFINDINSAIAENDKENK